MGIQATDIWNFIYTYLIYYHPVWWLLRMGQTYNTENIEQGAWLAVSVFGIAVWFGIARVAAETPGRQHGNMFLWWAIIATFHVWTIPIYLIYAAISGSLSSHWEKEKQSRFGDRSRAEIWAGSRNDVRSANKMKIRRRR